jgi:tol-pal system protein YbgF
MTCHAFRALLPAAFITAVLAATPAAAQISADDLILRIDRLENQLRQLTGTIEQLQYRNQQLDQALKRMQEDNEFRFQELGGKGGARAATPPRSAAAPPQPQIQPQPPYQPLPQSQYPQPPYQPPPYQQSQPQYQSPPVATGRRSDVFDPNQNPNAPGAPRLLGTTPASPPLTASENAGVGALAGRDASAPLDLTTLPANAAGNPGAAADGGLPPPPPRNPSATGARTAAVPAPPQATRDAFDAAYGAILRKDYAGAEEAFRGFLQRYPSDRLAPDAQYWLGESMFQRQNWREAADAFLSMSKKYESNPKAAEALLRLGQSLAALREKELACATFGEIGRKYPRASTTIKQAIEREQKRTRC